MAKIISAGPSTLTANSKSLVCLKGFKSCIESWRPFIDTMAQKHGFHASLLGFDDPGTGIDFIEKDPSVAYEYLEDVNKFGSIPADRSVLLAHSWGAACILDMLSRDETAWPIINNFRGIILVTPFVGASFLNGLGYGPLARYFSRSAADSFVGTTSLERWGTRNIFRSAAVDFDFDTIPIHRQALTLNYHAVDLLRRIQKQGGLAPCAQEIPITVIMGAQDTVCKNAYIKNLIRATNANNKTFDSGHYLLLDTPEAADFVAERATGMMRLGPQKPIQHATPQWPGPAPRVLQEPTFGDLAVA